MKFLKKMSKENLVFMIQKEYKTHCRMHYYYCKKCNKHFTFDEISRKNIFEEGIYCKNCGGQLLHDENKKDYRYYIHKSRKTFNSIFFIELTKRYIRKFKHSCKNIPDKEDQKEMISDILYVYYKCIMNYGLSEGKPLSKFNTYVWSAIKKKFTDKARDKGWISKNPSVRCEICGHYTGIIDIVHLMNVSGKHSKQNGDYLGHKEFQDNIIKENNKLHLNEKQRKVFLKKIILFEYQKKFPQQNLNIKNISLEEPLPTTTSEPVTLTTFIATKENNNIYETFENFVYENYSFHKDSLSNLEQDYPLLYNDNLINKKIQIIGTNYNNYTEKEVIEKSLFDLVQKISINNCICKDEIFRHKYINKDGTINENYLIMIVKSIELYLINDYSLPQICTLFGHDNITEEEIRIWIKKIKNNSEMCDLLEFSK